MRAILLFICILFIPAGGYAQPVIVVDHEARDVGNVFAGTPIEEVFEVRNAGDEDLVISRLVPS